MEKKEIQITIARIAIKFISTGKSGCVALHVVSGFMKSVFMNNVL